MKQIFLPAIFIVSAILLTSCAEQNYRGSAVGTGNASYATYDTAANASPVASSEPDAANDPWPMNFTDNGTSYTVYEPQCDSWDGHQMDGRSAVAVQSPDDPEPVYGVVAFTAITLVDKNSRTATLADFRLTSSDFPTAREQGQSYLAPVLIHFAKGAPPMPLDHLENNFLHATPKSEHLNNAPPDIIVATQPAVLVYIDGSPAWRPVAGTDLQRCINTRMLLLKDSANNYYVHLFDGYLRADLLDGSWTVAEQPPIGADIALKQAQDSGQVDLMTGTPDAATQQLPSLQSTVPKVYVATKPSELIQFNGPPAYASIPGTDLLYADNTSGNVFKSIVDQENYILISGRWYRSSSLDGPWEFVPATDLPKDFANIPDDSPKENVKASVPGTPQAREALIANSIPQSTAVARSTTMNPPQLDGPPDLAPIAGTPLHYVVNSATPIIEVDPQSWYACQNGVWYVATSQNGPWTVAASVPALIYTIPPESPLHYVTYVQIYGSSPETVYEGYTPGYFGTEISADGTVVYGTGYYYSPWVGTVWYGPPVTWGCGFDECWTPWWGWGFNCGFGWGWDFGWGFYPPAPWWCGFRDWHDHDFDRYHHDRDFGRFGGHDRGWANTGANLYHHQDQFGGYRYSGRTGLASDPHNFGRAYNSRTGRLAAGEQARVQRVPGAWNSGFSRNNVNGFERSRGFGTPNRWESPRTFNSWSTPRSMPPAARLPDYFGGNRSYYSPGFGGMNRARPGPAPSWGGENNFRAPGRAMPTEPRGGGFGEPRGGDNGGGSRGGGGGGREGGRRR